MKVTKTTVAKGTTERLSERVIQKELDIRSAVTKKTKPNLKTATKERNAALGLPPALQHRAAHQNQE